MMGIPIASELRLTKSVSEDFSFAAQEIVGPERGEPLSQLDRLNRRLGVIAREAEVYVPVGQQSPDSFLVAAAVSVIKTSWGWEEVKRMRIRLAGETVIVDIIYDGCSWIAILG